ncbi:MAG: methylmalonyl Co-A mutase-associated GTPase MeaB [Chloroflexi bacterium]|nr:methylmalonyl Co-A mutase-associated GTPase MeaB [Chloroflexota bacterium]
MDLVQKVLSGDKLALARLITQIENQTERGLEMLDELFPYTGRAHFIGITGSPGAGKSSLVNQLVQQLLIRPDKPDARIAVIAVDPTSPFSGGAVLGDRVRMRDLMTNPRIFIRSMASRGALGGLAHTTSLVAQVLDAAGFETILIETVGAGQTEVDIARLAHTVIVVEAPGMGDDIQAIKAGILEIADILVVNKSDHFGAENTVSALRATLELARLGGKDALHDGRVLANGAQETGEMEDSVWRPQVLQTIATQSSGIDILLDEINRHRAYLTAHHLREQMDNQRMITEFNCLMKDQLYNSWLDKTPKNQIDAMLGEIEKRKISPHRAVKQMLGDVCPCHDKN